MSHTPDRLTGKTFEQALDAAADREQKAGRLTMSPYGVSGTIQDGNWRPIQSLPDREGIVIFPPGRQFIFEAKCISKPSLQMTKQELKPRQVKHLLERSRFGAMTFICIHWNGYQLAKGYQPAFTVAIPVNDDSPRWQSYIEAAALAKKLKTTLKEQGSISRDESLRIGTVIPWVVPKGCRTATPDLLTILDPTGTLRGMGKAEPDQKTLPLE